MLNRSFMSGRPSVRLGGPEAHVGGEDAGEDLADERRPRRRADRDARFRIPEVVDAERPRQDGLRRLDHGGHRRDPLGLRLQEIGPVVLVSEQDRVDAAGLQVLDVADDRVDQLGHAAVGVVERRPRQRADMGHADDRLLLSAEELQSHGILPARNGTDRQ
jgi:hypothetical protein